MYREVVNYQPHFGLDVLLVKHSFEFNQKGLPRLDVGLSVDRQDWSFRERTDSSNHRDALQSLLLQLVLYWLIGELPCLLDVRLARPNTG